MCQRVVVKVSSHFVEGHLRHLKEVHYTIQWCVRVDLRFYTHPRILKKSYLVSVKRISFPKCGAAERQVPWCLLCFVLGSPLSLTPLNPSSHLGLFSTAAMGHFACLIIFSFYITELVLLTSSDVGHRGLSLFQRWHYQRSGCVYRVWSEASVLARG